MPLLNIWKQFFVTSDTSHLLSGDPMLGDQGEGVYRITARASAAADATIAARDRNNEVLPPVPIPVRAAAVTYPEIKRNEDHAWLVHYTGKSGTPTIDIVDGTNAEISVLVEFSKSGVFR